MGCELAARAYARRDVARRTDVDRSGAAAGIAGPDCRGRTCPPGNENHIRDTLLCRGRERWVSVIGMVGGARAATWSSQQKRPGLQAHLQNLALLVNSLIGADHPTAPLDLPPDDPEHQWP